MKKVIFFFTFLMFIVVTNAQDYKKVRTLFLLSQVGSDAKLEEAKSELDKIIADPKAQSKAESFALKAEIYGSIAANENLKVKYPTAASDAYQALQKYVQMEPTDAILKADGYTGVNPIYNAFYAEGIKLYNDKKWDAAYEKFKITVEIGDLFIAKKWSTSTLDTTSYLLAGASAQNAKKNEDAAKYYSKLADYKIKGNDYEGIYDFLTKYYLNVNNKTSFDKYLAIAKEVYPDNTLWPDLEFAFASDNMTIEEVTRKYDEASIANSLSSANYMDYGEYFINNKKVKALDPAMRSPYTEKAFMAFTKAATSDPNNGVASYNAGVAAYSLYEEGSETARKIVGATPEIKAKRAQAYKISDAAADKSIEWLEKSYNTLSFKSTRSSIEKNCINKGVDLLYNLFAYKKDRSRGVNPKDYDKYEAKAKFYDLKHNKF